MKILVIGGTVFLGRHVVASALASGHDVTTLNRGTKHVPGQDKVRKLVCDREGDLSILDGESFDAVIDTCGYKPDVVASAVAVLRERASVYVFVSSISAYGDFSKVGLTEDDPVKSTPNGGQGDYGSLKADCERVIAEKRGAMRAIIVRPGLIVGPHDPTDRFTYWPAVVSRGGEILAPEPAEQQIQFIDVRDLADWMIKLVESAVADDTNSCTIYNATGPARPLLMSRFLECCREVCVERGRQPLSQQGCSFIWCDSEWLTAQGVNAWSDMPLWLPVSNSDDENSNDSNSYAGFLRFDCSRARESGLAMRPLTETIDDTLAWHNSRVGADGSTPGSGSGFGSAPGSAPGSASSSASSFKLAAGLSEARHAELLSQWHAHSEKRNAGEQV